MLKINIYYLDREQSKLIEGDAPLVHKNRRSLDSTYVDVAAKSCFLLNAELNKLKISAENDGNNENFQLQTTAFYGNEWPS